LVKISQCLVWAGDIPRYVPVRANFSGDLQPAWMLAVIPALVRPEFLIEIEAYAEAPKS
jgi:2-iminobutanoate/2-iminopropanoate deaminase